MREALWVSWLACVSVHRWERCVLFVLSFCVCEAGSLHVTKDEMISMHAAQRGAWLLQPTLAKPPKNMAGWHPSRQAYEVAFRWLGAERPLHPCPHLPGSLQRNGQMREKA